MFNSFSILLPFQARERIYDKSDDELNHEDDTDGNDPSKLSSEPDVIVHDEKSVGAANEPATSEIALQPAFDMTPQTEGRSVTLWRSTIIPSYSLFSSGHIMDYGCRE